MGSISTMVIVVALSVAFWFQSLKDILSKVWPWGRKDGDWKRKSEEQGDYFELESLLPGPEDERDGFEV